MTCLMSDSELRVDFFDLRIKCISRGKEFSLEDTIAVSKYEKIGTAREDLPFGVSGDLEFYRSGSFIRVIAVLALFKAKSYY